MSYWVMWLVIVILLTIIEASTVNLVSIWFIASGIVSLFVSLFCDIFLVQFGIFVILGIILLLLTRNTLIKKMQNHDAKTNLDRIIGMQGVVTQEIKKNVIGEVKVDGKLWSAKANKKIKVGSTVLVKSMESVKLVVEEVVEEDEKEENTKNESKKNTKNTTNKSNNKKKTSSKKRK